MTDVLVRFDGGGACWFSSRDVTWARGASPCRQTIKQLARTEAASALLTARESLAESIRRPGSDRWFGCEHGKAILGRAIDAALDELTGRRGT